MDRTNFSSSILQSFAESFTFKKDLAATDNYYRAFKILGMDLFKQDTKKKTRLNDKTPSTYDEALTTGSSIGKIITNIWNSQKNPGKAYILNRRIHHGEIGILLELSNLFKKSRPATAGVLSGIGEALSNDDIADKDEWFKFKKKENKTNLETSTTETSRTEIGGSKTEKENLD